MGCEPSPAAAPWGFIPTVAASEHRCLQVHHMLVCEEVYICVGPVMCVPCLYVP